MRPMTSTRTKTASPTAGATRAEPTPGKATPAKEGRPGRAGSAATARRTGVAVAPDVVEPDRGPAPPIGRRGASTPRTSAATAAGNRRTVAKTAAPRRRTPQDADLASDLPRRAVRQPAGRARGGQARRVGIMGGTFDPIHNGHLVAASEVAVRFSLDEVIFVPTGQPWQKELRAVSPAEDRYLMTVIATASNPRFQVSRVDIDRGGPTYTVDTLLDLRKQYGRGNELFFITGADALGKILSWKDATTMFRLAHFVGVTRPGFDLSDDHLPADTVSLVQVPAMAISSTDCRERVAAGQPVWYLVPDGVVQYIAKRHLYR
jgi:nicotinate-nucleotide adenylyltransferase